MNSLLLSESLLSVFPSLKRDTNGLFSDKEKKANVRKTEMIECYKKNYIYADELKQIIDSVWKLNDLAFKNHELSEQLSEKKSAQDNILKLFKRYVPEQVISEALEAEDIDLMPPGEARYVSILFSDIRNFTRISGKMKPHQVVSFLNDYWKIMLACVKKYNGSVNKFMGDGLLAIFGAPVSSPDNHENAVYAALDMVKTLDKINEKYAGILGCEIEIGVGINTGEVVVGNIGTDDYLEYSVIGDTVNVASRLESLSKPIPNSIIISETTYHHVNDIVCTSELKEGLVAGKDDPICYCEVLAKKAITAGAL